MSLRNELRKETKVEHEALHEHALLKPLLSSELSLNNYILVLKAFYEFYTQTEGEFRGCTFGFSAESPVLVWLEKEKSLWGFRENKLLVRSNIFDTACFSEYVGYLYFKQGSTLGGRLISKSLEKSLGIKGGENGFFYHGYGDETGSNWKAFEGFMEENEKKVDSLKVIGSAKACFNALHEYFNEYQNLQTLMEA